MTYQEAKERAADLSRAVDAASGRLAQFTRGAMGLTPDSVKALPDYQAARKDYAAAFDRLRAFNAGFVKQFAGEIRAERRERRP